MKSHLKVKVVTLANEMTYIRRQEEKWKNKARYARQKQKEQAVKYAESNFWSLNYHRYGLKNEIRNTHLAYGCMKGVPYSKMEFICYGVYKGFASIEPNWDWIEQMVTKFSKDEPNPQEIMQRFAEWLAEAKVWYEGNKERIPRHKAALAQGRLELANDPEYQARKAANDRAWKKYNGMVSE